MLSMIGIVELAAYIIVGGFVLYVGGIFVSDIMLARWKKKHMQERMKIYQEESA